MLLNFKIIEINGLNSKYVNNLKKKIQLGLG